MKHGGDVLVEMLLQYGVPVVFGLAGGQTLPLYDAIRSRAPRIRHIPMRDERNAAYAADGYARISGRVGVCDATVGPGSIKFTSGLAEAYNSSIPLVALVSDMPHDWLVVRYRGGGNQLVDQMAVLAPLCKWTARLPTARKLPELVQRAFHMAASGRPGPVAIELPQDLFKEVQDGDAPSVEPRFGAVPAYRPAPDPGAVRAAVELLEAANRPVMIAGGGVWCSNAGPQLVALAERLALPVATTLSGKGAISETHPLALGVLGSLGGTSAARKFVEEADVILAVGFKFGQNPTYLWTLPTPGQRLIHLDIDGAEIGKVFPIEVGLAADARLGLAALLEASQAARPIEPVAARIAHLKAEWQANLAAAAAAAQPIKPQQVAALLNELAGPDDILVCDASFASGWGGMYFEARDNRRVIFPRGMAGLGWGLPAAIGAQLARPASNVIVLAGDGAMTYCLGELATLAQEKLNVKVVVLNNSTMGWIKWEQAVFWDGKFQSTDLSRVNFAVVAQGLGCAGWQVSDPAGLREALAQALAAEQPVVVDVETSASEAAVPKFNESASARAYMEADAA
ncbi:MAG: thiamine pyrophosphate-binding protein [Anaerolineales bacterium]|nr:thiamine pyrophosphate-binding protein [Anaerolineales bacterium]